MRSVSVLSGTMNASALPAASDHRGFRGSFHGVECGSLRSDFPRLRFHADWSLVRRFRRPVLQSGSSRSWLSEGYADRFSWEVRLF